MWVFTGLGMSCKIPLLFEGNRNALTITPTNEAEQVLHTGDDALMQVLISKRHYLYH